MNVKTPLLNEAKKRFGEVKNVSRQILIDTAKFPARLAQHNESVMIQVLKNVETPLTDDKVTFFGNFKIEKPEKCEMQTLYTMQFDEKRAHFLE